MKLISLNGQRLRTTRYSGRRLLPTPKTHAGKRTLAWAVTLCFVFMVLPTVIPTAQATEIYGDWEYVVENNEIIITKYHGND
jgi:hypothetical protein